MVSILKYINLRDPNDRLLVYSLLILKKVLILYFIALLFMLFVSFFTKSNNGKLIEGNWFKSDAQKRREAQQRLERLTRDYYYCLHPTLANAWDCRDAYIFPNEHLTQGMAQESENLNKRTASSKKPNKRITTNLNNDIKLY